MSFSNNSNTNNAIAGFDGSSSGQSGATNGEYVYTGISEEKGNSTVVVPSLNTSNYGNMYFNGTRYPRQNKSDIMQTPALSIPTCILVALCVGCLIRAWLCNGSRRRANELRALEQEGTLQAHRIKRYRKDPELRMRLINESLVTQKIVDQSTSCVYEGRRNKEQQQCEQKCLILGEQVGDIENALSSTKTTDRNRTDLPHDGGYGNSHDHTHNQPHLQQILKNALPHHNDDTDDHNVDASACAICLEHFKFGDIVAWSKQPSLAMHTPTTGAAAEANTTESPATSCCHVFHYECIKLWLINPHHNDCPYCRSVILDYRAIMGQEEAGVGEGVDGTGDNAVNGDANNNNSAHSSNSGNSAYVIVNNLVAYMRSSTSSSRT
jgi:Ring finger domain